MILKVKKNVTEGRLVPKTFQVLKVGGDIFESSHSSGIHVYLFGSHPHQ
jgi:hypothetical protein